MERVGDLLKDIFKGSLSAKGKRYYSFFKSWERILGKELSSNIKLNDIKKHTLLLTASHPGWMQMVYMKKDKLLYLINKLYPELTIKDIKISLGKVDVEKTTSIVQEQGEQGLVTNDPPLEIDLKKELTTLENGDLKDILKKLYTSVYKRR